MRDTKTMGKKVLGGICNVFFSLLLQSCQIHVKSAVETSEVKLPMILSAMLHESLHPKFSMNAFDDPP